MAWQAGRPHEAWSILDRAGMRDYWAEFLRTATRLARARYQREITRYER